MKRNSGFSAIVLLASGFLFMGCGQIIEAVGGTKAAVGAVTLNLSVNGLPKPVSRNSLLPGVLRTVYPGSGEASDFDSFTLSFKATADGAEHEPVPIDGINEPVTVEDLVLGTYTITVTADNGGDVVAIGIATDIEVSAESATNPVPVEIIMSPKTDGNPVNGTFAYDITVPDETESAALTITDMDGAVVDGNEDIDVKTTGTGSVNLAPGYYRVNVALTGVTGGGGEVLHIYLGMTSSWTVDFTNGGAVPPEDGGDEGGGGDGGEEDDDPIVTGVSPSTLAAVLADIGDGSADHPTTLVFNTFVVTGTDWGTTMYNALTGNTKYLVLDLSACTAASNTITGTSPPSGNAFNRIKSDYIVGVILPSTLTAIGGYAFYNWSGLKSVTIPSGVTSIGASAFKATGLTSVTFPENLTTLGSQAFASCPLSRITFLGSKVTSINNNVYFEGSFNTFYNKQSPKAGTYVWSDSGWIKAAE